MLWRKIIGIDLGTAFTRVVLPGKGIVNTVPTLIARNKKTKKIVAIGQQAEEMLGKAPNDVLIIRPLKNGVVSDLKGVEYFLKELLNEAVTFFLTKPIVVVSVPASINSVEKRALEEAVLNVGARDVFLFPISYLSALGADLNIQKPIGNMVLNIGAGNTESAILSCNGIVIFNSSKVGSMSINESLINYVKKVYGLAIGEGTSEKMKLNICSVLPLDKPKIMEIRGRDAGTGMPKAITLNTNDLVDAVKNIAGQVILCIKAVLEKTPPELSSDIVDNGIVTCGGGMLLTHMDTFILNAIGIPVIKVDNPLDTVANGIYKVIQNLDYYLQGGLNIS